MISFHSHEVGHQRDDIGLADRLALANRQRGILPGAAAQFGIFIALLGAMAMGGLFNMQDAAAIGIIGGADGPTAIFMASL